VLPVKTNAPQTEEGNLPVFSHGHALIERDSQGGRKTRP
jgi:hypothetical protein